MEAPMNGNIKLEHADTPFALVNGRTNEAASIEELERELPVVHDGQIPLGDLTSRLVQAIYAELSELGETYVRALALTLLILNNILTFHVSLRMPNMSDIARKRTLADWVVKTKKQVVKLYAVAKWSRDAAIVQKSMVHMRPL